MVGCSVRLCRWSVSSGAAPHGLDVDLWCPRDKAVSRPSPAGLNVAGASALSFLNTFLAHVCPATRSAAFQRSDASVAFWADKVLWPCQRMLPLLAVFTDVFKTGNCFLAKMACEIRCIRRGLVHLHQAPPVRPTQWSVASPGMAQNGLASGSMWPD